MIVKKTFCVGLTGGIGSGKTVTSDYFSQLGVPIIDTDIISRELCEPGMPCYDKILMHFGQSILQADKRINRKKLRNIIFNCSHEKKWLESLLHPAIRQSVREQLKTINEPYCICVIPLLAESQGIDFIDRVLLVTTPLETAKSRAAKRDNTTTTNIEKIIASQAQEQKRFKIANDILINDANLAALHKKIDQLHQLYLRISQ